MTRAAFLDRDGVLVREIVLEGQARAPLRLEDFHLVPGDLISFYGVAKDAASNPQRTEMYFLGRIP